jgi:phage terminase large subunit-like protein
MSWEALKQLIGSDAFSDQYQQEPVPPGGAMVKRDWINRYSDVPPESERLIVLQSWDTASKGGPLEDMRAGTALVQELKGKLSGIVAVKPKGDKASRMAVASAKFEAGQVFLPERAEWLPDFEAELFTFPGGRHDDQVDSVSQALEGNKMSFMDWMTSDDWDRFNAEARKPGPNIWRSGLLAGAPWARQMRGGSQPHDENKSHPDIVADGPFLVLRRSPAPRFPIPRCVAAAQKERKSDKQVLAFLRVGRLIA